MTQPTPAPKCAECERPLAADADPRRVTCSGACRARRFRKARATELARLRAATSGQA
jgi:DNA-directed RNA polymerase subunit RPC12/RpoP